MEEQKMIMGFTRTDGSRVMKTFIVKKRYIRSATKNCTLVECDSDDGKWSVCECISTVHETEDRVTSEQLVKIREEELDLTQLEMAHELITPVGTYRKWENGSRRVPGIIVPALNWVKLQVKK